MANKQVFSTAHNNLSPPDTVNKAGGNAYSLNKEEQLCQYVCTGTFNGTFYASSNDNLKLIETIIDKCSSNTIAKAAVYGRKYGKMKDVPAYLLAVLAARGDLSLLQQVFPIVINNTKMLLNFVQIVRSGVTGRKSFGTAVRRLIRQWIDSKSNDQLVVASIGHSKPSLADVIKMVHPSPRQDKWRNTTFAYILGKPYNENTLPDIARDFELFKNDNTQELPNLPFMALSNCELTTEHWKNIAHNMPWNTLRMNLNQLARHDVFKDKSLTQYIADKLQDRQEVVRNNAFPYQLLTTYQNLSEEIPNSVKVALNNALEIATENVPNFDLDSEIAVCIDVSGSMSFPITGYRPGASSYTTSVDVAALMAACILRQNPDAKIIGWDTQSYDITHQLNPSDSVLSNAKKIKLPGGGTDASVALKRLNKDKWRGSLVIYISDNQSWFGNQDNRHTSMSSEWNKFKGRNRDAKLVCVDVQPYVTTQIQSSKNVLNVGGFSDSVFDVIHKFVTQDSSWRNVVQDITF